MKQDAIEKGDLPYALCRYGTSQLLFRGPRKRLDTPYVAFIGGTETFGKFIAKPFPALVEDATHHTSVNFGCVNGGIDAFVNDQTVMDICKKAEITVIQVMGAHNLSNRFYAVHPRRNDRFLRASTVLQTIYGEVDFSEFTFIRHMLGALYATSNVRFEAVVEELRHAWMARMKNMIAQIGDRCILLWFSSDRITDEHWSRQTRQLQVNPLFITASMMDELRGYVDDVVVVHPSDAAVSDGTDGMFFPKSQTKAASEMLGVACHTEVAAALIPKIRHRLKSI